MKLLFIGLLLIGLTASADTQKSHPKTEVEKQYEGSSKMNFHTRDDEKGPKTKQEMKEQNTPIVENPDARKKSAPSE